MLQFIFRAAESQQNRKSGIQRTQGKLITASIPCELTAIVTVLQTSKVALLRLQFIELLGSFIAVNAGSNVVLCVQCDRINGITPFVYCYSSFPLVIVDQSD
jgi:hypothetical protein